jgi:hypothetical protein
MISPQGSTMPPSISMTNSWPRGMMDSLMAFRPSHLRTIESFATSYLTMDEIDECCLRRYANLFGRLRPHGSPSVPSDGLRRVLIVQKFLDLVQARRWSLERTAKVTNRPTPIWLLN